MAFDYPGIDVEKKTTEQNLQATKAYLIEMAEQLNYQIGLLKDTVNEINDRLSNLEGDN
jgi:hypothetical protein